MFKLTEQLLGTAGFKIRAGQLVQFVEFSSLGAKLLVASPDESKALQPPEEAQEALAKVGHVS